MEAGLGGSIKGPLRLGLEGRVVSAQRLSLQQHRKERRASLF